MIDNLLKILLLLSPIVYGLFAPIDRFDMMFFHIGTFALVIASLWEKPQRDIGNLKYILSSLWCIGLVNLFWNNFDLNVLNTFINLSIALIALIIIIQYCKEPKKIYKYIIYAGLLNMGLFLIEKTTNFHVIDNRGPLIGGDLTFNCYDDVAFFGNCNRLATYMALILPFMFNRNILLALLCIGTSLWCKEYTIAGPVALIFFMNIKEQEFKHFIIALFVFFIAYVGFFYTSLLQSCVFRFKNIWFPTLELLTKRPFLGYGLGNFYIKFGKDGLSSYAPFIYGTGVLGIAWIGYVLKSVFKYLDKSVESLAFWGLAGIALIEYPAEIPKLWFTIIFILAIFIIKKLEVENGTDKSNEWGA